MSADRPIRFKRGNQRASLQVTRRENHRFQWVYCLALLDEHGAWMYSGYWRAFSGGRINKQAIKDVEELGWERIPEGEVDA